MGAEVRVAELSFAYPNGREVLHEVGLTICPGERVALLGPNGAGKSTLALHLNGIHLPQSGAVWVDGVRVTSRTARDVRRRVGVVFQDPDDQLFMPTVREDVAFGPHNFGSRGAELERRVDAAITAVGLTDAADVAPHHLSLGQRRRAALATVLAMDVDVLVLDEPTANLDARGRRELIASLSECDASMLVVTHDVSFALELCSRGALLDAGRIVADGPLRQLLRDERLLEAHGLELPWGFELSP